MATIDEIFNAMADEGAEAGHEYLIIDPETRTITVPESERIFGVTGDELADRKYFMCPRYVGDGLDLAGMFLTVYFRTATDYEDGYLVDDVAVNGEYVTFSWQLWPSVTAYKGKVQFTVCADLPNTAEKRRPDWNTTLAEGEVLEGLDPDVGDVEADTSDVVAQLRAMVTQQTGNVEAVGAAQAAAVKAQGTTTTQEAVEAIQAQGAATLATIPAEYTDLETTVDRLSRGRAAAIVCEAEGTAIQVQDASNDPLQGLRIFGKSTQAAAPTPDAPVEIVSTPAPVVTVCGKNLLDVEGIGGVPQPDGSYLMPNYLKKTLFSFPNGHAGQMTISGWIKYESADTRGAYIAVLYTDGSADQIGVSNSSMEYQRYTHTTSAGKEIAEISASYGVGTTASYFKYVQIELGHTATAYEPYTDQTLAITTPGSLPGIPVANGGNYTDANGQQWIADEVDLARGVYVQRVGVRSLTGTETFEDYIADNGAVTLYLSHKNNSHVICSHAVYGKGVYWANTSRIAFRVAHWGVSTMSEFKTFVAECHSTGFPVELCYVLATPVETALTDAEIQAHLALHSNKPTTTVLNDAGAHMVLEYAADPKTYIDNKLAALVAVNN